MTINDRLAIILDSLDRRADFCVSGKLPFHAPVSRDLVRNRPNQRISGT